jgi:hypothetical protein
MMKFIKLMIDDENYKNYKSYESYESYEKL